MENYRLFNNKAANGNDISKVELQSREDPNNYYSSLVQQQKIALIPEFKLDAGVTLRSVPVAYSTWGTLNRSRDNVLVLCHALTGSSDALDWWQPLMGPGRALDSSRYFIFCANVLGSPYGSASPLSTNPKTGQAYGPLFPNTTVRDDVRIQRLVLDALGIESVAAVVGGSMGGMTTLEWPLCTPPGYVKTIVPIATSAYHGAWGISWGETQRHAIESDANFNQGWYEHSPEGQPRQGLATARMIAMLTYRSHGSFETRFSRRPATATREDRMRQKLPNPPPSNGGSLPSKDETCRATLTPHIFSAQSYMRYQGEKFLERFDANCYIHLTKKLDSHDITRGRIAVTGIDAQQVHPPNEDTLRKILRVVAPKALVVSVNSDMLFTPEQQRELSRCLPSARLITLDSPDGHDGFLLEFERLNSIVLEHLKGCFPRFYESNPREEMMVELSCKAIGSVFGESEIVGF